MSKLAKLLALSALLTGCSGVHQHHHAAKMGSTNIENQVTKNVTNHTGHVANTMANTSSAATNAAKNIK